MNVTRIKSSFEGFLHFLLLGTARHSFATIHYVDLNCLNPTPPYTNWATAASVIQDAVDSASAGDEVVVTNGVYRAGGRAVGANLLTNRVTVDKPLTLRSVNGPQFTAIEGQQVPGTTNGNGAIRCVILTDGAILCGFTLTNGATRDLGGDDDSSETSGGGVWAVSDLAKVSNCVLTSNSAGSVGGGACHGVLKDCDLTGNSTTALGGGAYLAQLSGCQVTSNSAFYGGGVCDCSFVNDCELAGNSAVFGGGAYGSVLSNCILRSNTANCYPMPGDYFPIPFGGNGGGAFQGRLDNCTLIVNSANGGDYGQYLTGYGGGACSAILDNCTLSGNTAKVGGGAAGYYGPGYDNEPCLLNDSIVYFNSPDNCYGLIAFSYCCTTEAMPTNGVEIFFNSGAIQVFGFGNITNAPLFVDLAAGNLRLQSNSPCINAGNVYAADGPDLDDNPRIVGGTVDIGAYEFQNPASKLSYAWLQQYGLAVDGTADFTDTDGDGMNNWQEWRCRTDPTDSISALRLLAPTFTQTNVSVTWQSVSGVTYFLECSTNLCYQPAFSLVQSNLVGQPGTTIYTDTNAVGPGPFFYRVGVGNGSAT